VTNGCLSCTTAKVKNSRRKELVLESSYQILSRNPVHSSGSPVDSSREPKAKITVQTYTSVIQLLYAACRVRRRGERKVCLRSAYWGICRRKRKKTGGVRVLHNEEVRVFHSLPDTMRVVKLQRMGYAAQPTRTEREELHAKF
jgi:hypothetical protein